MDIQGYTSNRLFSLRKEQIITSEEALSPNCINILMGNFNFVEDALDRNGKLPNAPKKTDTSFLNERT